MTKKIITIQALALFAAACIGSVALAHASEVTGTLSSASGGGSSTGGSVGGSVGGGTGGSLSGTVTTPTSTGSITGTVTAPATGGGGGAVIVSGGGGGGGIPATVPTGQVLGASTSNVPGGTGFAGTGTTPTSQFGVVPTAATTGLPSTGYPPVSETTGPAAAIAGITAVILGFLSYALWKRKNA